MAVINGEKVETGEKTMAQYLSGTSYALSRIAVELNGHILQKQRYGETVLKDGDVVEIVSFVGGG
ncbi:MAG: sulfur carrier protein ThiS [Oscillospiraceae bacterium]|nr:sulfur carrier protein ThiS [Oscillospiraceae bacterium]MDD3260808.1 sulfur carrier protein ThiS [Oscillospiraceae bacterium]